MNPLDQIFNSNMLILPVSFLWINKFVSSIVAELQLMITNWPTDYLINS